MLWIEKIVIFHSSLNMSLMFFVFYPIRPEMLVKISSASLLGVEAYLVEVEVDISTGIPSFVTVGLPDTVIRESRERVKAALKNCGYEFPSRKIIINLAPADIKKEGSSFDLPICLGLLAHLDLFPANRLDQFLFLGEVALDGGLKPAKGTLSAAVLAQEKRFRGIVIPKENEKEAALVPGLNIYAVENLFQVVNLLMNPQSVIPSKYSMNDLLQEPEYNIDFKDIKGQQHAKRALEVASAGGHNLLMIGPPGAGKTMLARRLPTILPEMTFDEIIDVTRIYSAAGLLRNKGIIGERPFRSPHHTITLAGLIGGGVIPKVGEVSLAHNGILFLDELSEFNKHVLEGLRQPLEDGEVTVSRASMSLTFPSRFILVAAMNPYENIPSTYNSGDQIYSNFQKDKYYSKISSPLLDRIDIQIEVPRVEFRDMIKDQTGESSQEIRSRVHQARNIQLNRFKGKDFYFNAHMDTKEIKLFCQIDENGRKLLEMAVNRLGFSARAFTRVLKVARSIADLEGMEKIRPQHLSEAIQYRMMDKYF